MFNDLDVFRNHIMLASISISYHGLGIVYHACSCNNILGVAVGIPHTGRSDFSLLLYVLIISLCIASSLLLRGSTLPQRIYQPWVQPLFVVHVLSYPTPLELNGIRKSRLIPPQVHHYYHL